MFADLLEEALDAWTDAREGVVAELENIPSDRYDFHPAEGVRSVAELACHIMEVSELMVGELSREETDFHRAPFPELLREHASGVQGLTEKEEILAAMESTLERGRSRFREVGELHMLQLIERFDGELGTRMAWMHHGIAQEMYHRGQLCTYERLMGLVPALTKRIHGEG